MVDYNSPQFSLSLKAIIEKTLDDKKAAQIVSIDLAGKSDIADYMTVASGTSDTHVGALASHVMRVFEKSGIEYTVEGLGGRNWVLIDTPYVVVHLFKPEAREYYGLEKMWQADFSSAKQIGIA